MRTGSEKAQLATPEALETAIQKGRDSVSDALVYLTGYNIRNFYAQVINSLDKVAIPGMGTMAVTVIKGRYLFAYDPLFAARVSYEEVCATCEHEVMHIILEHIPRYLQLQRIFKGDYDQALMQITANIAMDMAVNELLARSWPDMRSKEQPLGYWALPTDFEPPLPPDMAFETYQKLLVALLRQRLEQPATQLYQLAKAILKQRSDAIKEALQQQKNTQKDEEENEEGNKEKEEDSKSGDKKEEQRKPQDSQVIKDNKKKDQGDAKSTQKTKKNGKNIGDGSPSNHDVSEKDGCENASTQQSKAKNEEVTQQNNDNGKPNGSQQAPKTDPIDNAVAGLNPRAQKADSSPGQGEAGGSSTSSGENSNPFEGLSPQELRNELKNMDSVDQKILEMLLQTMPSHLGWEHGATSDDEGESHKLLEHGRELIKGAMQTRQKSRGTVPSHVMELINKMLMPPTVPWTQLLHNVVQHTRQTKKERGMARPSKILSAMKKFAVIKSKKHEEDDEDALPSQVLALLKALKQLDRTSVFPGIKCNNKYTMVFGVDTSGSMSTQDLQAGLSQLQHIQKADSDVKICVMYSDAGISKEYWIGPRDKLDPRMTGRGGTNFEPVFKRVEELLSSYDKAPDILIYCTDGYAPPPQTRLPIPVVWLLTPRGHRVMQEAGHITIEMRDYQLGESY